MGIYKAYTMPIDMETRIASPTGLVTSEALSMWKRMRTFPAVDNTNDDDGGMSDTSSVYSEENDSDKFRSCGFVNKTDKSRDNATAAITTNNEVIVSPTYEKVNLVQALAFYNRMAVEKVVFDDSDDDETNNDNNKGNDTYRPYRPDTPATFASTVNRETNTITDDESSIDDLRISLRSLMQTIHECQELLDDDADIDIEDSNGASESESDGDSFHTACSHELEDESEEVVDTPVNDAPRAEALYRFIHDEYEEERACNVARTQTPLEVVGINARFNNAANKQQPTSESLSKAAAAATATTTGSEEGGGFAFTSGGAMTYFRESIFEFMRQGEIREYPTHTQSKRKSRRQNQRKSKCRWVLESELLESLNNEVAEVAEVGKAEIRQMRRVRGSEIREFWKVRREVPEQSERESGSKRKCRYDFDFERPEEGEIRENLAYPPQKRRKIST